ncbi:uncharacterized protein MEPE_00704 [Melanopsichium pennsylvanicum]|uniref:Uncharacterized protein n=1 Tax=Melanopsichium pennsylvanicum TaxID=63383 RepID=A0AAJ4XGC5_9BASI|nr:uncharacterized protein MEPE_00704 [Melanopsichium pennsylvanicum]
MSGSKLFFACSSLVFARKEARKGAAALANRGALIAAEIRRFCCSTIRKWSNTSSSVSWLFSDRGTIQRLDSLAGALKLRNSPSGLTAFHLSAELALANQIPTSCPTSSSRAQPSGQTCDTASPFRHAALRSHRLRSKIHLVEKKTRGTGYLMSTDK